MGNSIGIDSSGPLLRWASVFRLDKFHELDERVKEKFEMSIRERVDSSNVPPYLFQGELELRQWFTKIDCWRQPWFGTQLYSGSIYRIYYFITCWSNIYTLLSEATSFLLSLHDIYKQTALKVHCTGSRRKDLGKIADEVIAMKHLMSPHEGFHTLADLIKLKGCQETHCTTRGFDFFLKGTPSGCFKYKGDDTRITIAGGWHDGRGANNLFLERDQQDLEDVTSSTYPYLLVHVKSGVSFHLVSGLSSPRRIGGSVIGAGTFLGLASILCPSVKTPFDAFLLACHGNSSKVDIQVSDIYGGAYKGIGLQGDLIASSFGKMQPTKLSPEKKALLPSILTRRGAMGEVPLLNHQTSEGLIQSRFGLQQKLQGTRQQEDGKATDENMALGNKEIHPVELLQSRSFIGDDVQQTSDPVDRTVEQEERSNIPCNEITECDMARSLLTLMTYNITQQSYLNALLHKVPRIVFSGFYLEMPGYLSALQACVTFWDKTGGIGGEVMEEPVDTVFVRMAPFLAAVGAAIGDA